MSRIRSKNTSPELLLRKLLYKSGIRYRIHYPIKGKPDIVFPSKKVAIFINGCFWHGHKCKLDHSPKSNTEFWQSKIIKNQLRDQTNYLFLTNSGWKVMTIWECEVEKNTEKVLNKILSIIKSGVV